MKISVFGMGYVGSVSAACLASEGHTVIGVDADRSKVGFINRGESPIIERGLGSLIKRGVCARQLSATQDAEAAVANSEVSLVSVGTPSRNNGSLDLTYVTRVCEQIGDALRRKSNYHVVVLRSTMLPGTINTTVRPVLEARSGKSAGTDFGLCVNPEFLREGTALHDYRHPPKTVIGASDERAGRVVESLYAHLDAPVITCSIDVAEMVKYADNTWHALKVGFANEIGNICKSLNIDSHAVMDVFCQDTKLNLSSYYLKPGFAFGGSCLPKDVRALTYKARTMDVETPILNAILPSNERQIKNAYELIKQIGNRKVGVLGLSFKAGTDDLRESPMVELTEQLIGKGYDLMVYDKNVHLASLVGANRSYILDRIPHISKLMVDCQHRVVDHADTIVIGNAAEEFRSTVERLPAGKALVDLVRATPRVSGCAQYHGLCW